VSDFEPQTDLPHRVEPDDEPVASTARSRDRVVQRRRKLALQLVVLALGAGLWVSNYDPFRILVAMIIMYLIFMAGFATLGAFARPIPAPLPEGEMRRVKHRYRCASCGAELKMTLAAEEDPSPPRHCSDEMELLTTQDEL